MATKLQQAATAAKTTVRKDPPKERTDRQVMAMRPETPLAVSGEIDLERDAGMGMEGADKDSFALPFLTVLQGLSPQLKTVEGARPGLIINTVTNELAKAIRFVPVAFQRRYNRWVPRDEGGGFKGMMTVAEVEGLIAEGKTDQDETHGLTIDGDQLKDTRNHFVLVLDENGGWNRALISLSSTQIKRSKRLMSLIQGTEMKSANGRRFNPPSFAFIYTARAETEKNNKGEFESWTFDREGAVADPQLYNAAKEFHAQVTAGAVVVAPPPTGDEEEGVVGKF